MRQTSNSPSPVESMIACTVRAPSTLRKMRSSSAARRILSGGARRARARELPLASAARAVSHLDQRRVDHGAEHDVHARGSSSR